MNILISIFIFIVSASFLVALLKQRPRYTCFFCGYKHLEKRTLKKIAFKTIKNVIFVCFGVTSLIGMMSLYSFTSGGIPGGANDLFSLGGIYAVPMTFFSSFESYSNPELEEIALNLTKSCKDDYCRAKTIYLHLRGFNYEEGDNMNPGEVWEDEECDCDECSYLLISLLKSLKIKSQLQCIIVDGEGHCYTIIKLNDMNILADITQHKWREYEK